MGTKNRLSILLLLAQLAASQTTTRMTLSLEDGKGTGLEKVRVVILFEPSDLSLQRPLLYRGISDSNGLVEFPSVEPGRYRICAAAPALLVLNPCDWKTQVTYVVASEQEARKGPSRVRLAQGVALKVTVEDEDDLVAQNEFKAADRYISFDLWNESVGQTQIVRLASTTAKQKSYMAIVPKATKFKLRVNSPGFIVEEKLTQRRVDEPDQDLEVDVLADSKEVVLSAKGLKTAGGAQ